MSRVVDGWVEALMPAPAPRQSMREWLLSQARSHRAWETGAATGPAASESPEIGDTVDVHGIRTNYHDEGSGPPIVLVHGSGPGVSAWANWRLTMPALADRFRAKLLDWYGKEKGGQVTYAEAFEICEYGRQPTREELAKLFPFFGEPKRP